MSDSLERLIVQYVIEGAQAADASADRVAVKLDSVERSGRLAEKASNDAASAAAKADAASRQLISQVTSALGKLQTAASLAAKAANLAGFDQNSQVGGGIQALSATISGSVQGAQLGGAIGGIPGAIIGGIGGGLLSGVNAIHEFDERVAKAAQSGAKKAEVERQQSIEDQLLREAGLSKLGGLMHGSREIQ